jgi:hypothetical protein
MVFKKNIKKKKKFTSSLDVLKLLPKEFQISTLEKNKLGRGGNTNPSTGVAKH